MRLFVAVWLDKELRETVGDFIAELAHGSSGVKWVVPEQLHFTLKFLGEQDPGIVARLSPLLSGAVKEFSPSLSPEAGFPFPRVPGT